MAGNSNELGYRIRFIMSRIRDLIYGVTFDPKKKSGKVIVNISVINENDLRAALNIFDKTLRGGFSISPYIKSEPTGNEGEIALYTMCSMTIDGVLLKQGIPTNPRGGGIIQVTNERPIRFTDFLDYKSTTIDPLEILMSQQLTSVTKAIETGSGKILANIREVPLVAKEHAEQVLDELLKADIDGVIKIGEPNSDALGLSVGRDHIGIVVLGGTNPLAAIREAGINVRTKAISNLMDISELGKMV